MTETDLQTRSRERVQKRWELDSEAYERDRARIAAGANGGAGIWATTRGAGPPLNEQSGLSGSKRSF